MRQDTSGTAARLIALMRLFAERDGTLGVKNISDALGLPMSTSHRLLEMLVESGFVEKGVAGRRYGIGAEFFRVASLVTAKMKLGDLMQPVLNELTARTGETSLLGLYLPAAGKMTLVAKCDSPHAVRYRIDLFKTVPLEWGSTGLAILAFLPPDIRDQVFAEAQPGPISGAVLARNDYDDRIAQVRLQGYAITESEKMPDSVGLAVPLDIRPGTVIGSLALTLPKFRFDPAMTEEFVRLLKDAAAGFSRHYTKSIAI